jgi:transposase
MLPRKVHIVDGTVRQLRELFSARHTLQSKRVALINSIRGCLKQEGYRLPEKFFSQADWRGHLERMRVADTQKLILTSYMASIESLVAAEAELTGKILAIEHEDLKRLQSIPGIGGLSSRVIVSAIDEVKRFESKKGLAKYGALTPRIYQSGGVTHLGRINRDGRHEVRRVLLQCAHTVARMKSYEARPLRMFFERVRQRRGKKIAIVALARKLLTIAYGVLRTQTMYDPKVLTANII